MARGETLTARVERIAAGGAGIVRLEGKTAFIGLVAPGDLVRLRITKEHKNWTEGELLEILEPSPERVEPVCPLYGRCGGCSLQHLSYAAQLEAKTAILKDAFVRIGGFEPPAIQSRLSAPYGYRNRVQFHKREESGFPGKKSAARSPGAGKTRPGFGFGFKERKSSRIALLEDCPVADAGIRKALKEGTILPPPEKDRFTVYSLGTTFLSEGGLEQGRVSVSGREIAMDVKVFFQSNAAMLEPLIGDLVKAAAGADRNLPLADIYSGVGVFASFLSGGFPEAAPAFPEVDLVEENKAALSLARENMGPSKKANYYALTDTAWIKSFAPKERKWGFMVLDPPREGLSGPLCTWLAENGPDIAAYVSCEPAALARDSRILLKGGYKLKELNLYDFYPQTAHVESLAVFGRE